ncbi:hypothetical protein NST99_20885 [Paenibacillus sp. FSL L8-0470]|uniref:hypothetical protein n=1 Tax=Paenibacillus sp. FSL L8-0470 TaxID=2954688 RepID=UPI0030F6FB1E
MARSMEKVFKYNKYPTENSIGSISIVLAPNIPHLPFTATNGVKYFKLVAEVVKIEIVPGIYMNAWGYME